MDSFSADPHLSIVATSCSSSPEECSRLVDLPSSSNSFFNSVLQWNQTPYTPTFDQQMTGFPPSSVFVQGERWSPLSNPASSHCLREESLCTVQSNPSSTDDPFQLPPSNVIPSNHLIFERPLTNFVPTVTTKSKPLIPYGGYFFTDKKQPRSDGTRVFVCSLARKINSSRKNGEPRCTAQIYLSRDLRSMIRSTGEHCHPPSSPVKISKRKIRKAFKI